MAALANNSYDREHWQTMLVRFAVALGKDGDPALIRDHVSTFNGMDRDIAIKNLIFLEVFGS